jgi:signal transduction histidine kinase
MTHHSDRHMQKPLPLNWQQRRHNITTPKSFYHNEVLDRYVEQSVNPNTVRQLVFFGRHMTDDRLIKSANYVRKEITIRLAHRIRDFQKLPFIVGTNPHIEVSNMRRKEEEEEMRFHIVLSDPNLTLAFKLIYRMYWEAFEMIRLYPAIKTMEDNENFCNLLTSLLDDGLLVIPELALGATECAGFIAPASFDRFMNTMLRSRISRRVIVEQHLAITANHNTIWDEEGYIGIIFTRCCAREIAEKCVSLSTQHTIKAHNQTIQVKVDGSERNEAVFAYIPEHIEYILYELLTNAMRHSIYSGNAESRPVRLTISQNSTDILFRVSDNAGGIPNDIFKNLWSYSHTPNEFENFKKIKKMGASMAEREKQAYGEKLGFGLPMSKVYAEYWGGELSVMTMDGFGTDAYVRIPRLGNQAENLTLDEVDEAEYTNRADSTFLSTNGYSTRPSALVVSA